MKRNFIKLIIILSMLLPALIPLSANAAASGTFGDNLTWELDADGTLTISGTGAMPDWNWGRETPWSDNGKNNSKITKVIIGDDITTIGNSAFEELNNLTSVDFGSSITSIGKYAFNYCEKLQHLVFTDNIKTIGYQAFGWCHALEYVYFTAKVETIENYAFACCGNLKYVNIPSNINHIGESAFYRCENLEYIEVDDNNANYSSFYGGYGGLFNKDKTKLIQHTGSESSYTIPDTVTTIGKGAFYDCNSGNPQTCLCSTLTSITIPASVTSIEYDAFYSAYNLENVYYGGSKSQWSKITIESGNTPLTNATIHYEYNELLEYLTYTIVNGKVRITDCNTAVSGDQTIPSTIEDCPVTIIDYNAFRDCANLKSIVIPDTVTDICGTAFENCTSLSEITLPDSLDWIGGSAFGNCTSLTSISLPAAVSDIGDRAFYGCTKLENINVSENNADFCSINGVLFDKALTTIIQYPIGKIENTFSIPDGVTLIKSYCFEDCINLSAITIPNSVGSIWNYAFSDCTNLKNVYYNGTIEQWNEIAISNYNNCNKSLTNSTKTFFAYIIIVDNSGTAISNKTQNMGETVDISDVEIPDGSILKLYTDSALTKEYSLDTPITENLTLYVIIETPAKIEIQETNGIFLVTPTGVENGNRIIFVCYNNGRMVYINPYVYAGERTIPFTTTETYDKIKIMVWESFETCVPLCEAEELTFTD